MGRCRAARAASLPFRQSFACELALAQARHFCICLPLQVGYAFRHFVAAAAQATTSSSAIGTRLKAVAPGATIAELADPASSLFYVDKSDILPVLESSTRMAALLRPQRWGKSVLLQMIGAYYDVANKSKPIVNIPGGNTPLAHSFSILHLDLAEVARAVAFTGTEAEMRRATEEALNVQILWSLEQFAERYNMSGVDLSGPLSLVVRRVAAWAASRGAPLYVLVDEYDALLRTLAITSGDHAVETLAGRQGPLRQFFGRFKTLHDHGLLPRMFITGASLEAQHSPSSTTLFARLSVNRLPTLRVSRFASHAPMQGSPLWAWTS